MKILLMRNSQKISSKFTRDIALTRLNINSKYSFQLRNTFFDAKRIPLGVNRYGKIVSMYYNPMGSGAYCVVGSSGVGKSVLLKRLLSYFVGLSKRPGIIFDLQSAD